MIFFTAIRARSHARRDPRKIDDGGIPNRTLDKMEIGSRRLINLARRAPFDSNRFQ